MGVLFDSIIYDLQSHGGVSVYYSEILQRITEDSAFEDNRFLSFGVDSKKKLDSFGIENVLSFAPRILERYRDVDLSILTSKNNVFHSSYYRLPVDSKTPVITTVHDFTYEKFVKGLPLWVHSWQKRRAVKRSDLIICVSNNTAQDLMTYCNVPERKIRVVYNGVSSNYTPLDTILREEKIVFVGARGGYKNFHIAVEAIQQIPHVELSIVGGGELNQSEIQLLENSIPGRYKWLGRLSDEQLNIEYNKSLCLLYPSSYEGFGIPILEAMRAGCPVIAVNSSSIPEVAGNACILIDEPNAEIIADAVGKVRKSFHSLQESGFIQSSKFSWDLCYNATRNIYLELI
ncbi:mannosyltransferase [Citrobacter amalonaticus]|uniref:glycosyltransferase family 4 protein n=1 Tax=Citrobacter amalonaticus TaxID=35703 RepID=UPI00209D7F45|nr:glycosyltransferase family 1 protein [Citrobacter amalonaticus]MCP1628616.1 mannosyltransferase [Citrobacter amalonaticus]